MIHRILVRKYIAQSSLLWLGLALALFAFGWVRVWVLKLIDMSQFQTILEQFREFEKFSPIRFDALFTYPGRIGMTFSEPVVLLCVAAWCIARGSDAVSGELSRGTLEMLLAQPVSRGRLLRSHAVVSAAGLALLTLTLWAGIAVGVHTTTVQETIPPPTIRIPIIEIDVPIPGTEPVTRSIPMSERVDVEIYAASILHLFAFGFFLLGLSTMLSSVDRYRWRTIGAVVAFYLIQLVIFGLSKAAESLAWLQSLTFFTCYKPQQMTALVVDAGQAAPWSLSEPMPEGWFPPLVYPLILLALGGLGYAIAAWRFTTRDLPAPL